MIQRSFSTSIYEQNKSPPLPQHIITADTLLDKHNSILLPDTLRASVLLRRIGLERSWTQDQVNQDISILDGHRLYTVRDLLSLSDYSWKVIDLLPLVKDLLRSSVDPHWMDSDRNNNNKKNKLNKKQKNKKTQPISVGSPVYPTNSQPFILPTSPVTLSSSPPCTTSYFNNNNTTSGDDKYIKPDESDPTFVDMICDDPLTIRNTLRNLSIFDDQQYDDDDTTLLSPTPLRGPRRANSLGVPKNVRFTDRNSIILDTTIDDKGIFPVVVPPPPISTTPTSSSSILQNRSSADSDSASSFDTATTDEDEEALMTAAAAIVTSGRSHGGGRRIRHSSQEQFSTPSTSPIA